MCILAGEVPSPQCRHHIWISPREVHEGIRELYTCDLCGFTHHRPEGLLDHKNKAHSTKYQVNNNS